VSASVVVRCGGQPTGAEDQSLRHTLGNESDIRLNPSHGSRCASVDDVTVHFDNPAGRLHRILGALQGQPSNILISQAWENTLHAVSGRHLLREIRVLQVMQLPAEIVAKMEDIADDSFDRDFAMRWYDPVQNALASSIWTHGAINQITGRYDAAALGSLEHCSYVLHKFRSEREIPGDTLSEIGDLLSDLIGMLESDSTVDSKLREFLISHARRMQQAVNAYFIVGPTELMERLDQAVGSLTRNKELLIKMQDEAERDEKSASKKFFDVLAKIALALSVTQGLIAIGHSAYSLESHLQHPAVFPAIEAPASASATHYSTPSAPTLPRPT
jgi:hypothetical protein